MLWIRDEGQGAPLVLLHAAGVSGDIWWRHIPRLAKRFRVLAVDLPGHGRSAKPQKPLSIEGMAEELFETLQKRAFLPIHLVGLSLGGMVAQMFFVNHPKSVVSLTLCDTLCEVNPALAGILEERAKAVERGGMAAILQPTLERWFSPKFFRDHPEIVASVEKLLLKADPLSNAQTWRAIAKMDIPSRLRDLPRPSTLVVNGSLDTSIPSGSGKRLSEIFGARFVELESSAHMAPLEAPEKFMDILESFLSEREVREK